MWNNAELVRQEKSETEERRQTDEMWELLRERIPTEIDEWLLDICHDVAWMRDIDDPSKHLDIAKDVLLHALLAEQLERSCQK